MVLLNAVRLELQGAGSIMVIGLGIKTAKKAKDAISNEKVEKFLRDHGFSKHEKGRGNKTPTDKYFVEEDSGKVTTYTRYSGRRPTFSRKTFDEPSFKVLREWMGYSKGGLVKKKNIDGIAKRGKTKLKRVKG